MHCHKLHHTMNQMGHGLPLMTGVDQSGVADRLNQLVPGYMPMGAAGMGDGTRVGHPEGVLVGDAGEAGAPVQGSQAGGGAVLVDQRLLGRADDDRRRRGRPRGGTGRRDRQLGEGLIGGRRLVGRRLIGSRRWRDDRHLGASAHCVGVGSDRVGVRVSGRFGHRDGVLDGPVDDAHVATAHVHAQYCDEGREPFEYRGHAEEADDEKLACLRPGGKDL